MPLTKSAKKKLRKDQKREKDNQKLETFLKKTIKSANKNVSQKNIEEATKVIDKAVKKHIIHSNKGAHLKSALSKLLNEKSHKKPLQKLQKKPQESSILL